MNIPELIQSLFCDQDQDVMAIHDKEEMCIKAWKVERLKEAASNVQATELVLSTFHPQLRIWFGDAAGTTELSELVPHLKRIQNADISFPIIIFDNEQIVDGAHRFVRALCEDKQTIPCKKIIDPPVPDIIIPLSPDAEEIVLTKEMAAYRPCHGSCIVRHQGFMTNSKL